MDALLTRSIPAWLSWLQRVRQQGIRVREGSLLQLTARQIAKDLLQADPFEVSMRGLCQFCLPFYLCSHTAWHARRACARQARLLWCLAGMICAALPLLR